MATLVASDNPIATGPSEAVFPIRLSIVIMEVTWDPDPAVPYSMATIAFLMAVPSCPPGPRR